MFRNVARAQNYSVVNVTRLARCFASRNAVEADEDEIDAARQWLAKLDADTIRKKVVSEVSFSRSSGPGGQNVNKFV